MIQGLVCIQVSENPLNSILYHEFVCKFRDAIVDHGLGGDKTVNILCDDAPFHSWAPTMRNFEDSDDKVGLTHLGGGLSMVNPSEYFIGAIKREFNKLPNKIDVDAMHSLHQVISKFDRLKALKC